MSSTAKTHGADAQNTSTHQPIRVYFKRTTLVLTSAAVAGVTTAFMVACAHDGVRVESFKATTKDQHARKQLLDAYNSYSGNAVSLLIKPVELFLTMVVAVGLLCFATDFSTSGHNSSTVVRFDRVLILGSATACYLLTNGFNALNVQLSPRPIESAITAQDLSLRASESSVTTPLSAYTGPERTPFMLPSDKRFMEEYDANALTNTILRNALVPIELNPSPQCTLSHVAATAESRRDGAVASYGFPARPWHHNALKRAFTPTRSLTIAVTDNSTTSPEVIASTGANDFATNQLPMSTQQALKLLIQSIAMTEMMLPWWEFSYLNELIADKIQAKYEPLVAHKESDLAINDSRSALLSNLLFQRSDASNTTSRTLSSANFLTQAKQTLFNFFSRAPNASASELQVKFTRIANISHGITFDSLTIEIPLRRDHLQREYWYDLETFQYEHRRTNASSSANSSSVIYYDLDEDDDCSRDACVLTEPEYAYNGDESYVEPQVHALGVCVDEDGSEDPRVKIEYRNVTYDSDPIRLYPAISCNANSNASIYTVSVGKRIQGDAIATRVLHDDPQRSYKVLRLTNARKIYSVTVTHISWELQELTETYGAKCQQGTDSDQAANLNACRGLWYELEPANSQAKAQHLVVGGGRLPLALLSGYSPQHHSFLPEIHDATRLTPLVSKLMRRPTTSSPFRKQALYDLVYPRRFGKSDWPSRLDSATPNCSAWAEDYIHYTESNHLYMESTLQPSYAAGFFFLFQDAVVRDVVVGTQNSNGDDVSYARGSVVLDFVGSTQWIDVNVSSPMPNVVLTLIGAALLLGASVAIGIFGGKAKERELQRLLMAHNVAELLIADKKYPPLLVGMTITSSNNGMAVEDEADIEKQQQQIDLPPALPAPTKVDNLQRFRIETLSLVRHGDEELGRCVHFPSAEIEASRKPRDFV